MCLPGTIINLKTITDKDTEDILKWCDKNDHLHQEINQLHKDYQRIFIYPDQYFNIINPEVTDKKSEDHQHSDET